MCNPELLEKPLDHGTRTRGHNGELQLVGCGRSQRVRCPRNRLYVGGGPVPVREQLGRPHGRWQVDLSPPTNDLGDVHPGTPSRLGRGKRETGDAVPGNDRVNGLIGVSLSVDQSTVEIKEQRSYASDGQIV